VSVPTRRLYLIRHGRADRAVADVRETALGPQHDPPLDALGREQAQLLARRLRLMPEPAAVYCSTLRRARETVAPFAVANGTRVTYRDDLAEWFGGAWEMREFEDIFVDHPEVLGLIRSQDPIWHLAPGGESGVAFQRRVVDAVEGILGEHPEGDVWIVCHGGVINAYIGHVLAIEEQEMFMLPDHASLNTVSVRGDERHLWFLNDTTHLTQPGLFDGP
jgi:broad specificity phosphatase PhoE